MPGIFAQSVKSKYCRATAQIAAKVGVPARLVSNAVIWGNHSSTQFPDVSHAVVEINGKSTPVPEAVKGKSYLDN